MYRRIILYLVFQGLIKLISGQTPVLDIYNTETEVGSSFTLNCTVTINDAIAFKLNNVGQGSCPAPFLSTLFPCNPSNITQSLVTSVTSWTISQATPADHGTWKCTRGTTDSTTVNLTIYMLPDTVLTQTGISSNTIVNETSSHPIDLEVDCLFSDDGPNVELQFDGGSSTASVLMNCTKSLTTCSTCTLCSAYSCTHTIIYNQVLSSGQIKTDTAYTLKIKVGVTGTTQTYQPAIFTPHTITFKSTSEVTTEGTTEGTLITSTPPSTESPPSKPNQCKIILLIHISYPEHTCEKWNKGLIGVGVVIVLIVVVCILLKRYNSKENNCCPNTTGKDGQLELSNANGSK